jgi:hypothetical protein
MEGLKDLRVPLRLKDMMRSAGFVDVEDRMIQLHTCGWSTGQPHTLSIEKTATDNLVLTDQRDYDIGLANRENVQRLLSSAALYPFIEILGYALVGVATSRC